MLAEPSVFIIYSIESVFNFIDGQLFLSATSIRLSQLAMSLVGELHTVYQNAAFLHCLAGLCTTLLEVEASGQPHVFELWLGSKLLHAPCNVLLL